MIWQDLTITLSIFALGLWTFINLFQNQKPPKSMSIVYSIALFVIAVSFFTLGLWVSVAAAAFQGLAWFALFIQSILEKEEGNKV